MEIELGGGTVSGGKLRRADLHVHTSCSADVLPAPSLEPEALYRQALAAGLDFVTFTDHDTMEAYDRIGWQRERLVTGVEFTVRDRARVGHTIHVNVYLLDRPQFRELKGIASGEGNLERFLACLEAYRLPYVYNHPFGFSVGEKPSYARIAELIRIFPVIEYNLHRVRKKNQLAFALARRYGRGVVAASDTHTGGIGRLATIAAGDSFRAYFDNIRAGEARLLTGDLTLDVLKTEMSAWLEMFFNLDRLKVRPLCNSGTRTIGYFVRIFGSSLIQDSSRRRKVSRNVCSFLNRSGAPAACYLKSQQLLAFRIGRSYDLLDALKNT